MATADVVMYDEEFNQIKTIISKLRVDANAKLVFLVDKKSAPNRSPRDSSPQMPVVPRRLRAIADSVDLSHELLWTLASLAHTSFFLT